MGLGLVMFDGTSVVVALPAIGETFGADVAGLQWVAALLALGAATTLPLSGALGDRFGARRVVRVGLVVLAASALVAALAPSLAVLMAARSGQGVAAALVLPNGAALLGANTAPADRPRTVGTWIAVSSLGLVLGPLGGGWLVEVVGWRAIFLVPVPVALLGLLGTRRLQETARTVAAPLDLPAVVTAGVGLALLCGGLVELGRPDRRTAVAVTALAVSAVALTAFVRRQRRSPAPVLDPALVRSPAFRGVLTASLAYNATIAGGSFLVSLLFQTARGASPTTAGLVVLLASIGMPLGGQLTGRLVARGAGRRGPGLRAVMVGAVGVLAVAYVVIAVLALDPFAWIVVPLALTGFTAGVLYSGDTLAVLGTVGDAHASSALAALSLVRQVGAVLGIAVLGSLATVADELEAVDPGVRAGLLVAGLAVAPCVLVLLRALSTQGSGGIARAGSSA